QIPAVFVVGGVAVVLFGLLPAHTVGAWAVAAAFLLLSLFGPVLQLDQAVLNASPFQHVPQLPSEDFTAAPMLWLTLVAAGTVTAGGVGCRRRRLGWFTRVGSRCRRRPRRGVVADRPSHRRTRSDAPAVGCSPPCGVRASHPPRRRRGGSPVPGPRGVREAPRNRRHHPCRAPGPSRPR